MKTETTGSLSTHTWPSSPETTTHSLIPIAYSFTSIDGTHIIPGWIGRLEAFHIVLNNEHSSYIVRAELFYTTPRGETHEKMQISGGLVHTFGNIPLDARNVKLDLKFLGVINSDNYTLHWEAPLGHWLTGQRHIKLHGYWPGATSYQILEEQFAND